MKLLFDQNISFRIVGKIADCHPGSKQVRELGLTDAEDIDIWEYAQKNDFVIVTFDADFYDISLIYGCPPKIVWLRTGNLTTNLLADLLRKNRIPIWGFCTLPELKHKACFELNIPSNFFNEGF